MTTSPTPDQIVSEQVARLLEAQKTLDLINCLEDEQRAQKAHIVSAVQVREVLRRNTVLIVSKIIRKLRGQP